MIGDDMRRAKSCTDEYRKIWYFCATWFSTVLALLGLLWHWSLKLNAEEAPQEIEIIGQADRGISFLSIETGDTVTFGQYEQNNNLSDGQEPIEWIVLDKTEKDILLISKYGLDVKQYHNDWDYNTWEYCSLRAWLNGDFLDSAFNIDEQKLIMSVQNQNLDNPTYNTPGGNDTYDRVFILNYQEAEQYFKDDSARCLLTTKYAEAQAKSQNKEDVLYSWLRTGGNSNCQDAAAIDANGNINLDGKCVDKYELVRPVISIDISSAYDFTISKGENIETEIVQTEPLNTEKIDCQELTAYLYQPILELNTFFDNLSEPVWSMGIKKCSNEQVYFRSNNGEYVTGIGLSACESLYSLNEIRTDMTLDEAGEILAQKGFSCLQPAVNRQNENYVYYDGDKTFINIWQGEKGFIGIELNDVGWGPHTDRQEVAFYMGKPMTEVLDEIDGLSVKTEESIITLAKEGIRFMGKGNDLSETIVDGIYLSRDDCEYSLYGIIPGDNWNEITTTLGFDYGGSGELIDPMGYVYYDASLRNTYGIE